MNEYKVSNSWAKYAETIMPEESTDNSMRMYKNIFYYGAAHVFVVATANGALQAPTQLASLERQLGKTVEGINFGKGADALDAPLMEEGWDYFIESKPLDIPEIDPEIATTWKAMFYLGGGSCLAHFSEICGLDIPDSEKFKLFDILNEDVQKYIDGVPN